MTRDEARAKCAARIARVLEHNAGAWDLNENMLLAEAFEILDSLNGIARVCLPEVTDRMAVVGQGYFPLGLTAVSLKETFSAMSAAGDLTNPPNPKP